MTVDERAEGIIEDAEIDIRLRNLHQGIRRTADRKDAPGWRPGPERHEMAEEAIHLMYQRMCDLHGRRSR